MGTLCHAPCSQTSHLSQRNQRHCRLGLSHQHLWSYVASHDHDAALTTPVITNGQNNDLVIQLSNTGAENYTLVSAAASYHDPTKDWKLVKNVTASKFNVPLIAGGNLTAPFQVNSE